MPEVTTRSEFDTRLESGQLALALAGISNVSRSYWSQMLPEFERYSCEEVVETGLVDTMSRQGFEGGLHNLAAWMGYPYKEGYAAASKTYLDLEEQALLTVLGSLERGEVRDNLVIETSGNFAHLPLEVRSRVRGAAIVVCLGASQRFINEQVDLYLSHPNSVIWGDSYRAGLGETHEQTLARQYPELLYDRMKRCAALAHVVIPHEVALDIPDGNSFLAYVRDGLPK